MKWTLIVLAVVAGLSVFAVVQIDAANKGVGAELRNNPQGERAQISMLLMFADGRSIPVNYLRESNTVFVGADGPWWREFRGGGAPVTLFVRGEALSGHATVVLDNPEYTHEVFARLRPTAPAWLPDWLNGKLVVITLQ